MMNAVRDSNTYQDERDAVRAFVHAGRCLLWAACFIVAGAFLGYTINIYIAAFFTVPALAFAGIGVVRILSGLVFVVSSWSKRT